MQFATTVSKTVAPAIRIGQIIAPQPIVDALKLGVQATCLNVSAITQHVAASRLADPDRVTHLDTIRTAYRLTGLHPAFGAVKLSIRVGRT